MSLNLFILILSVFSWFFFLWMSSIQILGHKDRIRIYKYSIPVWIWLCGLIVSGLLITLVLLDNARSLTWLDEEIVRLIYLIMLCLLMLYWSGVVIGYQLSRSSYILGTATRIKISLLSGVAASFGLGFLFATIWILNGETNTANVGGLVCILIPAQIIITIGTYSQLKWSQRFEGKSRSYYEAQSHSDKDKGG